MNDSTNAKVDDLIDELSKLSPHLRAIFSYKLCLQQLESLRIPFVDGEIFGSGHTLIKVTSWKKAVEIFETTAEEGSIAVLHSKYSSNEENQEQCDDLLYLSIYIRIGNTNTWIYQNIVDLEFDDSTEEEDYDEEDYEEETEEQKALMKSVMLELATNNGFTSLRTIDLRSEFAEYYCKKENIELPSRLIGTTAYQAFTFYEFGILPTKAKRLFNEGHTAKEIAQQLGITKAKVEKSLNRDVQGAFLDYLQEMSL